MSKFRVVLNAWLLALILFCVISVPIFAAYSDCAYYLTVTVSNNSSTSYSNLRIVYDVNPASLVAGGYMQVDADDVYLTNGSTGLSGTALGMASDSVHWLGNVSSPAHSSQTLRLYTGWPAAAGRVQNWLASSSDYAIVADTASLDITTNVTVSADLYLGSATTGLAPIIYKPDNYFLLVSPTDYYFGAIKAGATAYETLRPNGVGDATGITSVNGNATHWGAVAEPVADDATSYVYQITNANQVDYYTLGNSSIPDGSSITSVTVYYKFRASGAGSVWAGGYIRLSGTDTAGAWDQKSTTNWAEFDSGVLARPGGGTWTKADLDSLQVGLGCNMTTDTQVQVTQVYAYVAYVPPAETYVTTPVTLGSWHTVKGTYNGTAVGIYVDSVLCNSTALSGALHTGLGSISGTTVLEFDGSIDNLKVGSGLISSPTWVLNFPFEVAQISSTQIMDQTGTGNNASYTLGAMPSGTGTAVGSLVPITLYVSTSVGGNTAASEPQVIPAFNIPLYENTTKTGSDLLGYDLFVRGAASLGWSSATLYSVMFMEAAIAFGFAATIGTGTLFFGALAGMGLLTLGAATGLLAWWIPLILGLLTFMSITVFKEL